MRARQSKPWERLSNGETGDAPIIALLRTIAVHCSAGVPMGKWKLLHLLSHLTNKSWAHLQVLRVLSPESFDSVCTQILFAKN